ncbi:MAG TPA: DMT family transporter [Steroidobacteraceae bacterium]|nr:DMT family transporter [Steroidobacteraceae bacterium]
MTTWRVWVAFISLGIIWGLPYFFIRIAVQEVSPFVVAWGRITLAALVLLPIAWHRGALRSIGPHIRPICAFAVVEFVIPFSAISAGEQWISSSIAGILISGVPLTVVLISRFFGVREQIGPVRALGLALGLIGVLALLGFGTISGPLGWAGAVCLFVAMIGYALGPLIIQRHLHGVDSLGPVAASLGLASAALLIPAAATFSYRVPSATTLISIGVLGLLCTAVTMFLMFYIVRNAGASRASLVAYINPAVAALLGVGFLHERLGIGGLTGFALILLGSWLGTRGPAPERALQPEPS